MLGEYIEPGGIALSEYRNSLRTNLHKYSHCSRELCNWNLYFKPMSTDPVTGKELGPIEINTTPYIIDRNGHAIDAYETAHLLEFIYILWTFAVLVTFHAA